MPGDWPFHLLLPLTASIVFVFGLMLIKKANGHGVNQWTVTFCANLLAFALFSNYLWLGDSTPAASDGVFNEADTYALIWKLWQPATIALLFIAGQVFTFSAISVGEVSLATPVFSVKVIFVAILLTLVSGEQLTYVVWCCAALATAGVAMVQFSGSISGKRAGLTTLLALLAATSFATHDLFVQQWAPHWPMSLFLPAVFGITALLSFGFLPFMANPLRAQRPVQWALFGGALCIALQAICIVSSLSLFGDAARVNIVYSLRGLWGVLLVFLLAKQFNSSEASISRRVMVVRIVGACVLALAVGLAISSQP